ncbi:hypothetical protein DFR37_10457 [Eoetvoesiella caeni]|uniref:EamA-like transporter family protein n=1 Tax=Eoetvoesiella caeni TaxID=645616 RepID=A0A366HC85_9BURK|nr:hypothetical protein DFR37_10457 [Eoetvoesiella caeni]
MAACLSKPMTRSYPTFTLNHHWVPMLAVSFGIVLNDEPFQMNIVIGTALVIVGLGLYFFRTRA